MIPSVEDELQSQSYEKSTKRVATGSLTYDTKKFNDLGDEFDSIKSRQ